MLYNFFIYFTALLSVTSATLKGVQKLFPESREYVYKLETKVSTGAEVPVESFSYWSIEAKLYANIYNVSRIRYRLVDIKNTIHDGVTTMPRTDLPAAAMVLKDAWDASYEESGALVKVYIADQEPLWSSNIKKAIALHLQLVQPENANSMSYSILEPCLHGTCIVEYSSTDGKTIRKSNDIPTAQPGYGRFFWYSAPVDTCYDREMKYPFVGSAEKIYKLDRDKGLVALHSRSALQYHTSSHIFTVNTDFTLTLERTDRLRSTAQLPLNNSHPVYYPHYYRQPFNGRVAADQAWLAKLTKEYLTKITKGIDENRVLPNRDLVHNLDVVELQKIMSQLDYDSLLKLYEDLAVGTSYETETSRNIFFEMLPHLKSSASALLVKYLVIESKQSIEDTTLLSLIRKLPFNVANYSEDLLTQMEAFTILAQDFKKDIRYACILSYATLAHYTYTNGGCSADYFGNIVTKYFKMYTDYPGYQDRLIWLQGLSNLQVGPVHNYLAPKIMNSSTNLHERFLGLWAMISNVAADPSLSSTLSWPILSNENEPIKLRIAALLQILSIADQTPGRILDVHNYITRSDNGQLKKFWHTTIKSLKGSEYNCCPLDRYISRITKRKFNVDPAFWATGNHMYDLSDKNNKGSAYLQLIGIGEPSTNLPAFAYFYLRTTRDGSVVDDLGIMVIAEGVPSHFYMKLTSISSRNTTVDSLVNLLKKLKVETVHPEKIHIDVIVKIHGKTIYAVHLNHTALSGWEGKELQRYVQDFLHSGSHINQQLVSFPMQVEQDLPTEFGTPVTLQNTMTSLSSLRGGLSASWTSDRFTFETDLTFRYRGTALTSLSAVGPVILSEHTARAQQSVVIQLPIKIKIDTRPEGKTLRYNLYQPPTGVAVHGRAQVQVTWENRHSNGTNTTVFTIGGDGRGVRRQHEDEAKAFTDCDDFDTISDVLRSFTTPMDNKIHYYYSFLSSNFVVRHGMILMTVHPSGSCGYYKDFKNYEPIEVAYTLRERSEKIDNLRLRIDHEIRPKNSSANILFQQNIGYSLSIADDNLTNSVTFGSSMLNYLVCINETGSSTSTNPDTSTLPADFAGQFRVHVGSYRNGTCPRGLDEFNTLLLDYSVENLGLYSDEGVTRYLTLRAAGKLDEFWASYISGTMKIPYLNRENFNLTLRVKEHNGLVAQSVDGGHQNYYKSDKLGILLEKLNTIQLLRDVGIYRKCTLKENSVQTFNGSIESFKSSNCGENLVLAECTQKPRFAITRSKNGNYNFYIANDRISVTPPTLGVSTVQVNGVIVFAHGSGYTNPEKTFKISLSGHAVVIRTAESGIRLYHTPRETSILVPSPYMNFVCGECTSHYAYNDC